MSGKGPQMKINDIIKQTKNTTTSHCISGRMEAQRPKLG